MVNLLSYSSNASRFTLAMDENALDLRDVRFSDVFIDEDLFRVITIPVEVEGQPYGWLQLGMALTEIRFTLRLLQIAFLVSAVFALSVSVIVGGL
jgi:hypothetical protein